MSRGAANTPSSSDTETGANASVSGWDKLRDNDNIQFEPVVIPEKPPSEPGWFEQFLRWLSENLNLAEFFVGIWPVLKWVLLALAVAAVLVLIFRLLDMPFPGNRSADSDSEDVEWVPDKQESLALLEEADRLAAEGRFDEATHLLLKRSVGQIAAARPDWVEPSSTARELAALQELSQAAREAFGVIAERVERSLFALRQLERGDWEAARSAYADFAIAPIRGGAA